jgi:hypothetical protein
MFHERLTNPARKYTGGRFHPYLPPGHPFGSGDLLTFPDAHPRASCIVRDG